MTSKPKSAANLPGWTGPWELDFSAKRILLTYNDAELPSPFQIDKLPRRYLERALSQLQSCHQAISSLSMIHMPPYTGYDKDGVEGQKHGMNVLLKPLLPPLHRMQVIVHKICQRLRMSLLLLSHRDSAL